MPAGFQVKLPGRADEAVRLKAFCVEVLSMALLKVKLTGALRATPL